LDYVVRTEVAVKPEEEDPPRTMTLLTKR
jgi:hypothetical protein